MYRQRNSRTGAVFWVCGTVNGGGELMIVGRFVASGGGRYGSAPWWSI